MLRQQAMTRPSAALLVILASANMASAGFAGSSLLASTSELLGKPFQHQLDEIKSRSESQDHCMSQPPWRRLRWSQGPGVLLTCKAAEESAAPEMNEHNMLAGPIPILFDLAKRAFQSFQTKRQSADDAESEKQQAFERKQQLRQAADQLVLNKKLFKAAEFGYAMETERLLRKGAEVNARNPEDLDRWTALHYASAFGRVSASRVLLAQGADPNIADWDQWTPLHYAAYGAKAEHVEIARALVEHGADVFAATWSGKTPLRLAEEYALPALADLLREAERSRRRPAPPQLKDGIRVDRDAFLQHLVDQCPPPSPEGPGRVVS